MNGSSNTNCTTNSFCQPEHLMGLSSCWEWGCRSLTLVQGFKMQEKNVISKGFLGGVRKTNCVSEKQVLVEDWVLNQETDCLRSYPSEKTSWIFCQSYRTGALSRWQCCEL